MQVPTQDQVMGQLRIAIPAIGTLVAVLGVGNQTISHYEQIALASVGFMAYIITAVWSLFANSRASIMLSASKPVDAMTPAPQIVLPPQEADLAQKLPENVTTTVETSVVPK